MDAVVVADPSGASEAMARKALGVKLTGFEKDHVRTLAGYKPGMALVTLEAVQAPPVIRAALEANCDVLAEKPSCVRADVPAPLAVRDTVPVRSCLSRDTRDIAKFSLGAIASRKKQSGQEFPTHNML